MARKTIRVRLYRVQDYDLYTLFYDPVFSLGDAFRIAVRQPMRNNRYSHKYM